MTIFAKIIAGEIPCYKIWEDDNHLAFLDIRPINKGHTLVIPKKSHDYIFDISTQEYHDLWSAAHKVAKLLKSKVECTRVVTMVLGYEVHHTHIHLIPTLSERDVIPFTPISMSHAELGELAQHIMGEKKNINIPRTEEVVEIWDQFAPIFSKNYEKTTIRLAKSAMEYLQVESANHILEVGGGAGASAKELRKITPQKCKIISTDISPVMHDLAKKQEYNNIDFQIADAQNLGFEDASFDRYFANLNLMLIPNPQKAIQEAYRVLQENSSIAVWTIWGRPEFSPMMMLFTECLQEANLEPPPIARSNFHMGMRTKLQNWLKETGFSNLTMWYQPMVVSFDNAREFVEQYIGDRRDSQLWTDKQRQQVIDIMLRKVLEYRQRCEPISLDTLIVVAHK